MLVGRPQKVMEDGCGASFILDGAAL
jgi:hypothetical protein